MNLLSELNRLHARMQDPENWVCGGICCSLDSELETEFQRLSTEWPGYSGNPDFPVTVTDTPVEDYKLGKLTPPDYYWDTRSSEYALKRWQLLEWCILRLSHDE